MAEAWPSVPIITGFWDGTRMPNRLTANKAKIAKALQSAIVHLWYSSQARGKPKPQSLVCMMQLQSKNEV